jgi:hypothetical protein
MQTLGLCHYLVVDSSTRTMKNFIRCFPSVTGKGRNDTKIKQVITCYLIHRHLMLNDGNFPMT